MRHVGCLEFGVTYPFQSTLSERLIFMMGDVINDRIQEFLKQERKLCLTKPFSLTEFEDAIQQALPKN
jgi:hypothetical protein